MRYCFILAFTVSSFPLFASSVADSLKVAALSQRDSTLTDTYIQLARYYFQTEHQPDSMIKYATLAEVTAVRHNLTARIIRSKKALGLAYTEARKFDLAEKVYAEAMEVAKQTHNVEEIIAINNKLGYLFGIANDLAKSAYYYLNSATEFEKLGDYRNLGLTYKNVVVIFTIQDQPEKIIAYTDKSLELISKLNRDTDADIIVSLYSSAAQHYFLVGEKSGNEEMLSKALLYADDCLRAATLGGIDAGLADAYYVMSHGYLKKRDYGNAVLNAKKALAYKGTIPERTVFNIYTSVSKAYLEMSDYKMAQVYVDSCKSLSVSNELDAPLIVAEMEYHLYKKMGKEGQALTALENMMSRKQELQDQQRNKAINDLEVKYQSELKEARIEELNQQNKIDSLQIRSLIALAGIAALVIVVIVFLYRQSVVKNKLNAIGAEQRLNRARMNPHFFFNALTSLQQYALRQTDGLALASSLSQFSQVMRTTLESTYDEYITLEREITFLNQYLDIQKIRYPKSFAFSVSCQPGLEADELVIPSMIVQPFVENSIEHGLSGIDYDGTIIITFGKKEDELLIEIADNGKGMAAMNEKDKTHTSRAAEIIKDRIYLLNLKRKSNARYRVAPNPVGRGVLVSIYLPLRYKDENTAG